MGIWKGRDLTTLNYIFRQSDWVKEPKRPSENKAELFFVFVFLWLQIFVDFRQGANQ